MKGMAARKHALCSMQKMAKSLMAKGFGDDEDAGKKLMSEFKKGEDHKEEDEEEVNYANEEDEEEPEEEMSDLEQEMKDFFGNNQSNLPAGRTKMVFEVKPNKKKFLQGKA